MFLQKFYAYSLNLFLKNFQANLKKSACLAIHLSVFFGNVLFEPG